MAPQLLQPSHALLLERQLLEQRLSSITQMNRLIAERDATITAQSATLDQRWEAMNAMEQLISERDITMAVQTTMLDQRWEAMQAMDQLVAERDQTIKHLEFDIRELQKTPALCRRIWVRLTGFFQHIRRLLGL